MPTILAGQVVPVFFSSDGSISITPGSAGRVSLNARAQDGSQGVAPREIYSAQTINVQAGTTVVVEAINTDASYTVSSSSGGVVDATSVQAALSSDQAGGRTALGLGTAATQPSTAFASNTEVATFANLPAAASVTVGRMYTVLTGVGAGEWKSDGTLWRPVNAFDVWASNSPVAGTSGGSTAEQPLRQIVIPAGMLLGANSIHAYARITFSAGSDANARTVRIRLGAAGSTADLVLSTGSIPANQRQCSVVALFCLPTSTTARQITSSINPGFGTEIAGSTSTPSAADVTIDSAASALTLTFSAQQGASPVDTVTLANAFIRVR